MTVIPFPAHRRHWRRRAPLSVRAALAGWCLLVFGALAALVSLVLR